MNEQLKCLCASTVSVQSVPEQHWHRLVSQAALLFYFYNSWAKEPRSVGENRENQRKILGLSNLCSKTWISEPGMLVLPVEDVG